MINIKDFPVIKLYVKEWGVDIRIKVNTSDLVEGKVYFLPMIKRFLLLKQEFSPRREF